MIGCTGKDYKFSTGKGTIYLARDFVKAASGDVRQGYRVMLEELPETVFIVESEPFSSDAAIRNVRAFCLANGKRTSKGVTFQAL